jgi:hypothetical protein
MSLLRQVRIARELADFAERSRNRKVRRVELRRSRARAVWDVGFRREVAEEMVRLDAERVQKRKARRSELLQQRKRARREWQDGCMRPQTEWD